MAMFTFDFGWSKRVPDYEGRLCRVLEIHAPASLLQYAQSSVEIQDWGSLAFWYQENPECMTHSEVQAVDDKLERMAHTLLVQRAANDVVMLMTLGVAPTLSR